MNCPDCSGPIWDNTEKVAGGWTGPIRKCRDQEGCKWIKWPEGAKAAPKVAKAAFARTAKWTWPTVSATYRKCLLIAKKHVAAELKGATPADVLAATATLFIAAARDGVVDATPAAPAELPSLGALRATTARLDQMPEALATGPEESDDLPF